MQVFIINLAKETKRRAFQEKQFKALELKPTFIKAISNDDIDDALYKKHYYDWQRPLRIGEMGCYFSHQSLWKKIISNNEPALILEDDSILSKETKKILSVLEKRFDIDMVNLENVPRRKVIAKKSKLLTSDYNLFQLYLNGSGSGAYVLYPSGAKKLLSYEIKNGIAPTDTHIPNCRSLSAFQIEPTLAIQSVFCKHYQIDDSLYKEFGLSTTIKGINNKREFIFRIKRIIAQIKLGLYQLRLLPKAEKRFIDLISKDFIK